MDTFIIQVYKEMEWNQPYILVWDEKQIDTYQLSRQSIPLY